MSRFVIEHLPRSASRYRAVPLDYSQARAWLQAPEIISLVRTTELITAIGAGLNVSLTQSDTSMTIKEGDEALLLGVSFGVLLAWAEGKIPPLQDDWRCILLSVESPANAAVAPVLETSIAEPTSANDEKAVP